MTPPRVSYISDDAFIDGEYQLCMRIAEAVYANEYAGIKSIKTKLFFSNEYYSGKFTREGEEYRG